MGTIRFSCFLRRRELSLYALSLVSAATLLGGCESSATSPSPIAITNRRIVVLGDSLAVSPSMAEAFPTQLQARIDRAGLNWRITNASVSGDTTADALRRLPPLLTDDVDVLVVALG